jgi:hypothetical protein
MCPILVHYVDSYWNGEAGVMPQQSEHLSRDMKER